MHCLGMIRHKVCRSTGSEIEWEIPDETSPVNSHSKGVKHMHKVRCILALSLLSLTHAGAAHGHWVQMNGAGATGPAARTVQKLTLKVVKVDSEGTDGKGAYAVDGNPNTIWHTQ